MYVMGELAKTGWSENATTSPFELDPLVMPKPSGGRQSLTMPLHDEIDKGTLRAIMRQAARHVPENELRPHFYTE